MVLFIKSTDNILWLCFISLAGTQRNAECIFHFWDVSMCVYFYGYIDASLHSFLIPSAKFIILFKKSKCFVKFSGRGKSLIIYNFTSCIIKATVLCTSLYLRQIQKDFGYFFILSNSYLIRTNFVSDSYWKFHYFCSDSAVNSQRTTVNRPSPIQEAHCASHENKKSVVCRIITNG